MENNNSGAVCRKLLQAVDEASFFMQDLKLYLDTHPNDAEAVKMFREACSQYKECKEAFECNCYPLTSCGGSSMEYWDWLNGAWLPERV